MDDDKNPPFDAERRRFLVTASGLLGGIGALCALKPFLASLMPTRETIANSGPLEIDISHLRPGELMTVVWRGKPVWILKRTDTMLKELSLHDAKLRDPLSHVAQQPPYARNQTRSIHKEYLVVIGVCTHLGCTPFFKDKLEKENAQSTAGFHCPCHGSNFDLAGRVFKGCPAPINLEVPPHYFVSDTMLVIGEHHS